MEKSENVKHKPSYQLAHDLINKLSAVIGHCYLLLDKMPADSPLLNQLFAVHNIAKSMAQDVVQLQHDFARARITNSQNSQMTSHLAGSRRERLARRAQAAIARGPNLALVARPETAKWPQSDPGRSAHMAR